MKKLLVFKSLVLFLILSFSLFAQTEVVIFHMNDTHARVQETTSAIGYAKISAYIEAERANNKNVLVLDAGDTFHGTVFANLNQGESILAILNALKLNAMSPGNHDFNYGSERLEKLSKKAKFSILAANVVNNKGKLLFKDNEIYTIKNKKSNIKIGVFGLATPETAYKTHPKNVQNVVFLDPLKVAREQIQILKSKGADIIIAVNHLGIDESTNPIERSTAIANLVGVDIVIDGHSHSVIDGLNVRNTLLVQTGGHSTHLGRISITIDDDKSFEVRSTLLNKADLSNITPNAKVLSIINKYNKQQESTLNKVVATIPYKLEVNINNTQTTRTGPLEIGQLVANSLLKDLNADIALVNGGGIRAPIEAGEVKYLNVLTTLPFGSFGVLLELKGVEILEMLESSVAFVPNPNGGYLQVSDSLSFNVNSAKKAKSRVSDVKINNMPLEKDKIYKVATLDFIAAGGDGYKVLVGKTIVATSSSSLEEVFANYLAKIDWKAYNYQSTVKIN